MIEKIASSDLPSQTLTAAEFLYYDAQRILEDDPDNVAAAEIQNLMIPLILSQDSGIPPYALLAAVVAKYRTEEEIRFNEREFSSIYLATVGLENVGKALVTEYLSEKYGFEAHPLSDQLRQIALTLGYKLPMDRDDLFMASKRIKGALGDAVLLRFAESQFAKINQDNRILYDGIRLPGEADWLYQKESSASITSAIIAIVTGLDDEDDLIDRYIRSLNRGGDKDPKDNTEAEFDAFKKKSDREAAGIKAAIEKFAVYTIKNEYGKKQSTYQQIDECMRQLDIPPVH